MLVERNILTNHAVYHTLHLTQFLVGHLLEMREVEAQSVGTYIRTLLLYMVAKHLLEGIVEQVSGCMVGGTGIALVNIDTCHKVGCRVFWQLLNDMYALVVLALGVDNLDSLVLAYKDTAVSHLSSHLAIERSVVEHQFVEALLLLCHLAIA